MKWGNETNVKGRSTSVVDIWSEKESEGWLCWWYFRFERRFGQEGGDMRKGLIEEREGSVLYSTGSVDVSDIAMTGGACGAMTWAEFAAI